MKKTPIILEIVGLAGTGKSTILSSLTQRNKEIQAGYCFKKILYLPCFINIIPLLFWTFLCRHRYSRQLTWQTIKVMVFLSTLHYVAKRQSSNNHAIIMLDQGPVYMLTWLHMFVLENVKNQRLKRWWENYLNKWASTLDIIIRLEAPDKILIERVYDRNKWHMIKEKTEQDVHDFLARYRRSYEHIISRLTLNGGPRMFSFNTNHDSINHVVNKILNLVGNEMNVDSQMPCQ
jgi:thymidylate kinase